MKNNEYRCAMCREVFTKGLTDEEAKKEAEDKGIDPESSELVCDDCYEKTPWANKKEELTPESSSEWSIFYTPNRKWFILTLAGEQYGTKR